MTPVNTTVPYALPLPSTPFSAPSYLPFSFIAFLNTGYRFRH